ncbi:unnamed protein product [Danaus chrysippus]|uniref:(African queen) hypothetical protein n=1 Tax=Danaus chrysippus TaxID=151541 RepID=A0A8J2W4M6_9NEOP|nr:unnamed protein product [Danaus chrysippus]
MFSVTWGRYDAVITQKWVVVLDPARMHACRAVLTGSAMHATDLIGFCDYTICNKALPFSPVQRRIPPPPPSPSRKYPHELRRYYICMYVRKVQTPKSNRIAKFRIDFVQATRTFYTRDPQLIWLPNHPSQKTCSNRMFHSPDNG